MWKTMTANGIMTAIQNAKNVGKKFGLGLRSRKKKVYLQDLLPSTYVQSQQKKVYLQDLLPSTYVQSQQK